MKLHKDPKYFNWGITALSVIIVGVACALVLSNLTEVLGVISSFLLVFSPVAYGLLIAYILNPVMVRCDKYLNVFFEKKTKMKESRRSKISRILAVLAAMVFGVLCVYGFFAMLLPNLVRSLTTIINNLQSYYDTMESGIDTFAARNPDYSDIILTAYNSIYKALENWLNKLIENDLTKVASSLATSVYAIIKLAMNLLIGIVAAIYLLLSKEKFLAETKKVIIALMKRERADKFFKVLTESNRVFSGFINGKLVDSLIIGILCYIGMLIINLPYPVLISTIIGVTNIIPFFGPIIGLVPCAVLILLINPIQALYFTIFILALQQVDGNIIGPRILGDAVGLPSFWILVSITVFGSLFGFIGMIFGVPVFAVMYMLFKEYIEKRLIEKGAPVDTEAYYDISKTLDLDANAESFPVPNSEEITEEELQAAEKEFWK